MNKISWVAIILSIVALIVAVVGGSSQPQLGAEGDTNLTNLVLSGDAAVGDALTVTGASTLTGDATLSGGASALTLTTSNTATSTAVIGCINTYATSTATAIHLTIGSGANATTTYDGTAAVGTVGWRYGVCP